VTPSEVVDLQRLLRDSPDSVTHLLEKLTGEPVPAESGSGLAVEPGGAVTRRVAVLKGRLTQVAYLSAETMFVPERLPPSARTQLGSTSDPIGSVLAAHGMTVTREDLPEPAQGAPPSVHAGGGCDADIVWARSYRLRHDGAAVFAIREWFFRSVLDALDRHAAD
jgi:chorismate-pyruvate lyase